MPPLKSPAEFEVIDVVERHPPAGWVLIEKPLEDVGVNRMRSSALVEGIVGSCRRMNSTTVNELETS